MPTHKKRANLQRTLHLERLESRLPLSAVPLQTEVTDPAVVASAIDPVSDATPQLLAGTMSDASHEEAPASLITSWAQTRGVYMFSLIAYQGDWAPRQWNLAQWETWLDTMQFLNLNHLQLPRAPWSERPGLTQFELDQEELWIDVLQSAKARGMTTSLIFGTTWHGDLTQAWRILSPGNSPADPNWQTLVADYNYWANRFGPWVDEWTMGVEDPGGSPSSAGIAWPYETPSPLGNSSDVSELIELQKEMRTAAQSVNPTSRVVAETWGLHWWGLSPGYSSHLNEFIARVPTLPADVPLSTNALSDSVTNQLQATGRDVDAWPFFLIDHEFPVGHTKLHFTWTRNYLRTIKNQGIDDVVTHITHPMEQLPGLYVYSRLLENTEISKTTLLQEFASFLVSDSADQVALANAISNLGLYYDSVSSQADWSAANLQPVNATAPYAPRYSATQLGYLNNALSNINVVDSLRPVSQIPMNVSVEVWIGMLRDQIEFLHDAAYIGNLITESATYLNNGYASVAALAEPLSRASAQAVVDAYLNAGSAGALERMETYLQQFWVTTTGQNHPLGIIYDFLRTTVPVTTAAGLATVAGDYLEYDAPGFPALFKRLVGLTEETDYSFSYLNDANWVVDATPGVYSGGSARTTSQSNDEVNIIFSGTGISLVHSLWNQGAVAEWKIDGGAGGSGTIDMFALNRQDQVTTHLAAGLDQTLHILTIKKSGGAAGNSILVDAVNVENNNRLRREDNREFLNYSGPWAELGLGTPSGGSWQYTISSSASVSIPFDGTAIAIAATTRADYGVIAWSIDGGAGGSGTVSLANVNNTSRKPFVLTTNLANGAHTLTLTKQSGFLINLDAIDVASETEFPDSPDFDIDGDVDGRDFLTWQRGFGLTPPNGTRSQGDADNDYDVDGSDLSIWQAGYGQSPLVSSLVEPLTADPAEDTSEIPYSTLIDFAIAVSLLNTSPAELASVIRPTQLAPTTEEIDLALDLVLDSIRDYESLIVPRQAIRTVASPSFDASIDELVSSLVVGFRTSLATEFPDE